ncbi:hypothetical protein GGR50DRAFT_179741 [Xylaria sp. CBS 124048]|nr:hypothetical protein GGR50DRAFT_179741 [Xylaria sp. CBS 124048]
MANSQHNTPPKILVGFASWPQDGCFFVFAFCSLLFSSSFYSNNTHYRFRAWGWGKETGGADGKCAWTPQAGDFLCARINEADWRLRVSWPSLELFWLFWLFWLFIFARSALLETQSQGRWQHFPSYKNCTKKKKHKQHAASRDVGTYLEKDKESERERERGRGLITTHSSKILLRCENRRTHNLSLKHESIVGCRVKSIKVDIFAKHIQHIQHIHI